MKFINIVVVVVIVFVVVNVIVVVIVISNIICSSHHRWAEDYAGGVLFCSHTDMHVLNWLATPVPPNTRTSEKTSHGREIL